MNFYERKRVRLLNVAPFPLQQFLEGVYVNGFEKISYTVSFVFSCLLFRLSSIVGRREEPNACVQRVQLRQRLANQITRVFFEIVHLEPKFRQIQDALF